MDELFEEGCNSMAYEEPKQEKEIDLFKDGPRPSVILPLENQF